MAGYDPTTGRFNPDPTYTTPGTNVTGSNGATSTTKGGVTTFTNPVWTITTPSGAPVAPGVPAATGPAASGPTAGTGQKPPPTVAEDPTKAYYDRLRLQQQAAVRDSLSSMFNQFGLSSLYGKIVEWAKQDYSADTIMLMLRQTTEYKQRFPAMEALAQKGRGISEADYIGYERTAANYEQMYGLPQGMLTGNVTNLLVNDMSVAELEDRVQLAAAASVTAPQDFKDEMRDRFGLSAGGLTAYYLDPDVALPLLEKQYAMAVIGTEARRQGVDGISTDYLGLLQNQGVTQEQAKANFGEVAYAEGLTTGAGETATTMDLAESAFGTSADAQKKVQRVAGSRVARFQQGGGYAATREGLTGLGGSST